MPGSWGDDLPATNPELRGVDDLILCRRCHQTKLRSHPVRGARDSQTFWQVRVLRSRRRAQWVGRIQLFRTCRTRASTLKYQLVTALAAIATIVRQGKAASLKIVREDFKPCEFERIPANPIDCVGSGAHSPLTPVVQHRCDR